MFRFTLRDVLWVMLAGPLAIQFGGIVKSGASLHARMRA